MTVSPTAIPAALDVHRALERAADHSDRTAAVHLPRHGALGAKARRNVQPAEEAAIACWSIVRRSSPVVARRCRTIRATTLEMLDARRGRKKTRSILVRFPRTRIEQRLFPFTITCDLPERTFLQQAAGAAVGRGAFCCAPPDRVQPAARPAPEYGTERHCLRHEGRGSTTRQRHCLTTSGPSSSGPNAALHFGRHSLESRHCNAQWTVPPAFHPD